MSKITSTIKSEADYYGIFSPEQRAIIKAALDKAELDPDRLLTTAQAADYLGLTVGYLSLRRHKGQAPDFIVTGPKGARDSIKYRFADLQAFKAAREKPREPVQRRHSRQHANLGQITALLFEAWMRAEADAGLLDRDRANIFRVVLGRIQRLQLAHPPHGVEAEDAVAVAEQIRDR